MSARYMFAYGSNLNVEQMARRCPAAKPVGRFRLPGWRLVFRGVADCIREDGASCWGGVWLITPACERALDDYEGCRPDGTGLYRKEYIPIKAPDGSPAEMLIYCMNSTGIMPPSSYYLHIIEQGYRDFAMPGMGWRSLRAAQREAWDDKAPTNLERNQYRRNGRPRLAARPKDGKPDMPATGQEITLA